jgi:uncharacterized protein YpuA (DUF1002 family)
MENMKEENVEKEAMADDAAIVAGEENTIAEINTEASSEPGDEHLEDHDESASTDYSNYSKKELLAIVKEVASGTDFKKIEAVFKEVKPVYEEIRQQERQAALAKFKAEGGAESDFEYRLDETDHAFDATLKLIRDRRAQYFKSLEESKAENLRKKNEILERLRNLIDGEDSAQSFQQFKEIQQEWKQVGPVPASNQKTLWANYNALVDRFYDHRNIYFELKELDRRKNLEAKLELCGKAERLLELPSIKDAVRELNELHHEFKHIGPVPKEEQENVWQRFKKASDEVYARRDAFVANLQKELHTNHELKEELVNQIAEFAAFTSDRIKDWNQKTQEILQVQKKWDQIGAVPRSKAKDLNKRFWTSFKSFFHNKGVFFKKLDEERDANLKAKQELLKRAHELKMSEDWNRTSQELIELQRKWKEIGPVPEKARDKIYKEFKEACDYFFEQRRGTFEKADQEQEANLKLKEEIIEEMKKAAAEKSGTLDGLGEFQTRYDAIGFVPKRAISSIRQRFDEAVTLYINSIQNISPEQKEGALLEAQLATLRNDPHAERKIIQKEQTLRRQITKAENDLAVLRNNLEFFGRSKNADKFKEEFNQKIKIANDHLIQLRKQLKLIKSA